MIMTTTILIGAFCVFIFAGMSILGMAICTPCSQLEKDQEDQEQEEFIKSIK